MIKELNWKKQLLGASMIFASIDSMAVSPGATQQAIGNIQPEIAISSTQKPVAQPGKSSPEQLKKALIEQLLKNKAFKDYLQQKMKHPYYTDTPKSVFTPAGTPMRWGGVGLAGNLANRYPSQTNNTYNSAFSAALPFGNSETSIGGALAVGSAQLGPSPLLATRTRFGQQGSVGLTFSRWLAKSTIATAGVVNLIPWGAESRLIAKSYYGGVTQVFGPTLKGTVHPIGVTLGLGTGGFTPMSQLDRNGLPSNLRDNKAAVFANASINLSSNLALIGDYYSETFAAGVGYNTVVVLPLSFMLYAGNLRHSRFAPSTTVGLRIAMGLPFPGQ